MYFTPTLKLLKWLRGNQAQISAEFWQRGLVNLNSTQIIRCPIKSNFLPFRHLWFNDSVSTVKSVLQAHSTIHTHTHIFNARVCFKKERKPVTHKERNIWLMVLPTVIADFVQPLKKCDDVLLITAEWYIYTNVSVELMVQWFHRVTAALKVQTWSNKDMIETDAEKAKFGLDIPLITIRAVTSEQNTWDTQVVLHRLTTNDDSTSN